MTVSPRHYATARGSFSQEVSGAGHDMAMSFQMSRLWFALGNNDIVARYRGSILGPFWITLTTIVFVTGIGFLYAGLMHVSVKDYLPYITTGIVLWNTISATIMEGADGFIAAGNILRQTNVPLPLFIWRIVWRNILTFAHQLPVIIGVALIFHYALRINIIAAFFGLAITEINIAWIAFCVAIISARYRDMQQVINSLMQLVFFLTPIIWGIDGANNRLQRITKWNPIYNMLEVTRSPLLGKPVDLNNFYFLILLAIVGWLLTFGFFAVVRRRIVHYV